MRPHKSVLTLIAVCILMMFAAPAFAGIIYVTPSGTGGGTSWVDAANLQNVLTTLATSGDEIWVAAGIYNPHVSNRVISFTINNGVSIYGGFAGTENTRDQRDWQANATILSGDIGIINDSSDNSHYIVSASNIAGTVVLDGLTITDGNDGYGLDISHTNFTIVNCTFSNNSGSWGGAIKNFSSTDTVLSIDNCIFLNNSATWGGGIYNTGKNSMLSVTHCSFFSNSATWGGAICNIVSISNNISVDHCVFLYNSANYGGGISSSGILSVSHCTFSGNTGGGMSNGSSNSVVTNCIFSGNTGGGMYNSVKSSPTVTNCTFSGNTGGGMSNGSSSNPTVTNCILWGNSPNEFIGNFSTPVVTWSIIEGGYAGTGNLDVDPLFVAPVTASSAPTTAGNYRLLAASPAIDTGNNTTVAGITTDLDGNPRIAGAAVDMGAYELAPEINVKQGTTNIASAGSYDFGNVAVGSDSGPITFTIENTGNRILNLNGTPKIVLSGTDAADFSVDETSTSSPVAANSGTTTFTVRFTPSSAIAETATISIANDDSDENPYTVTLTGTGTDGTTIPPVIPGPPLPIVITAEVSDITATGAASGGNVVYPEGCTALLVGRGVVWGTVSSPTYPQYANTFDGWASGEYTSSLTNLVPQTKYYIRAYVQYKLNGVVYTRYSDYVYNFTTPAIPGDVNGDKILDLKDAILALKIVAGAAGNAAINLPADVNNDGKIGVEEAVYVLQNVGNAE